MQIQRSITTVPYIYKLKNLVLILYDAVLNVYNGNCTEWNVYVYKSHSRFAVVRFCNHAFDFRPKLHDTKGNFHFITLILKSTSSNASLFTKSPKLPHPVT